MTLPTFLGIGVPRAATTWLHELLASHPSVYVPTRRKEIHFFDWHYERGFQWYEKFFPSDRQAERYQAIGEFTPHYLYNPLCPERIVGVPSITKLILVVRNPIDRAYSHYRLRVRRENYSGSFEAYLSLRPELIQWGFYSQPLRNYLRYFRKEQILVLISEHAVADVPKTKDVLASFLGIAADRFPVTAGVRRVNRGYVPKARSIYAVLAEAAWELRKRDLDWVINLAKRLGIKGLFGEGGSIPPMKEEMQNYLRELYEDDIGELEALLQMDLECWKQ